MHYLFLITALVLNAGANILIKISAGKIGNLSELTINQIGIKIITNPILILGIMLFALNIIFYFLALSKINLSLAYPIMTAGGLILISIFATLFMKEALTSIQIIGMMLIMTGIFFIAYHMK